jgi:UDPglucose--hexose-1-phosphate uridylyltransferase
MAADVRLSYDPTCYLCPGNSRAGGLRNPQYATTFVFTNDFAAMLPDSPQNLDATHPLLRAESLQGTCRVLCFSPRHDLTLGEMECAEIRLVIDLWSDQVQELGNKYCWVQVFENRGAMMGASNPHPHGQIWAGNRLPNEPAKEDRCQVEYLRANSQPLLLDYVVMEEQQGARVIVSNEHWLAVVPFWAVWPFESLLLPRQHVLRLYDLDSQQRDALADIIKRLVTRYDNLFEISFPYSMGWHGAPNAPGDWSHWQLHAHFYPPLLRSATVRKFMVGYEMLAEPQRDITPEQAADRLRSLPEVHFRNRSEE